MGDIADYMAKYKQLRAMELQQYRQMRDQQMAAALRPCAEQSLYSPWYTTTTGTDANTYAGTFTYTGLLDEPGPPREKVPLSGENVRWLTKRVDDMRVQLC